MRRFTRFMLLLLLPLLLLPSLLLAAERYKIAYFEGAFSPIFRSTWEATQAGLEELGWGDRVEYPEDAFYSPGHGDSNAPAREAVAKELMARDDLALIFSAGSEATRLLLKYNNHKTPILGGAIADPLRAGFIASVEDSGVDNFTARIVPGRYKRMFQIFHAEIGFQRLGLLYVDTPNARTFANVDDALEVAAERDFAIIHYHIADTLTAKECMTALESLVEQQIDAFFIPSLTCFEWGRDDVKRHLDFLIEHRIPVFARQGSSDVRGGALMGFSAIDYTARGRFMARMAEYLLEGGKARDLKMVDENPPRISINLEVAQRIGFDPSFDILGASDEIYQEIILPEDRLIR